MSYLIAIKSFEEIEEKNPGQSSFFFFFAHYLSRGLEELSIFS